MTFVDEGNFTVHLCASLATFWNTLSKQIEQLKKSMTRGPNETCAKRRRERELNRELGSREKLNLFSFVDILKKHER